MRTLYSYNRQKFIDQSVRKILEEDELLNISKSKLVNYHPKGIGIYLIKSEQWYKIGITNDLNQRLKAFETSNPHEVKVIAFIGTTKAFQLEKRLHRMFANKKHKDRVEWFALDKNAVLLSKRRTLYIERMG